MLEKTGTIIMRHLSLQMGNALLREDGRGALLLGKDRYLPCLPVKVLWKKGGTDILYRTRDQKTCYRLTKKENVWKPSSQQPYHVCLLMRSTVSSGEGPRRAKPGILCLFQTQSACWSACRRPCEDAVIQASGRTFSA